MTFVTFVVKVVRNSHRRAQISRSGGRLWSPAVKAGMMRQFRLQARFRAESVLEVNPVMNQIKDLKGRCESLRGYL